MEGLGLRGSGGGEVKKAMRCVRRKTAERAPERMNKSSTSKMRWGLFLRAVGRVSPRKVCSSKGVGRGVGSVFLKSRESKSEAAMVEAYATDSAWFVERRSLWERCCVEGSRTASEGRNASLTRVALLSMASSWGRVYANAGSSGSPRDLAAKVGGGASPW